MQRIIQYIKRRIEMNKKAGENSAINPKIPDLSVSNRISIDSQAGQIGTPSTIEISRAKETAGKPKLTYVPRKIIYAIARVREYGINYYGGEDSWKNNSERDYKDAAYRHFMAYLDDPNSVDEKSGLPHLDHLATNIAFLIEGGFKA